MFKLASSGVPNLACYPEKGLRRSTTNPNTYSKCTFYKRIHGDDMQGASLTLYMIIRYQSGTYHTLQLEMRGEYVIYICPVQEAW